MRTVLPPAVTTKIAVWATAGIIGLAQLTIPVATPPREVAAQFGPDSGGPAAGNLNVGVPLAPTLGRLPGLCRDLLILERGGPGAAAARRRLFRPEPVANAPGVTVAGMTALEGATGGSRAAAAGWCRRYLHAGRR